MSTDVGRHDERLGRSASAVVWLIAGLDVVLLIAAIAIDRLSTRAEVQGAAEVAAEVALYLLFSVLGLVGALIATRVPRNPIGWLILVAGTILSAAVAGQAASQALAATYVSWASGGSLAANLERVSESLLGIAIYMILVFVPLYFPDGSLPSRPWRIVLVWAVFGLVLNLVGQSVRADVPTMGAAADLVTVSAFALAVAAIVVRFRRGDRAKRQQIKWFAAAATVAVVGYATSLVDTGFPTWAVFLFGVALLPVSIAVAVLRYRLYDIDRIISRSLTYAVVSLTLAVVFYGLVVGLQTLLEPATQDQTIPIAASTLVAAALFQPLRRRIQSSVDRRFNRSHYDAERTAAVFASRLRDEVDVDALASDLVRTTGSVLGPASSAIWLRGGSGR